ncbi:MAG TPA: DUF3857 domain-containing protein [Myxococcales bacterium]|jgi:Flp pilus assembly protein TadD
MRPSEKTRSCSRLAVAGLALSLALAGACATTPVAPTAEVRPAASSGAGWEPGAGAQQALEEVWAAKPFAAKASTLARASGGRVARMHPAEVLLIDSSVRLEPGGRAVEVERTLWRVLDDAPDQTLTFEWSPWRQERPQVRARVVSADGAESLLDPKSIVEGVATVDGLQLSDVHRLQVPLPQVRRGSVVELEVVHVDTRPMLQDGGHGDSHSLWGVEPVRRRRFHVQAPASAPLKFEVVGAPAPQLQRDGERQLLDVEVGELDFKPFGLTRSQLRERTPRFGWTTWTSWEGVARGYGKLLEPVFADEPDLSSLSPLVAQAAGDTEKAQAVLRWVSERVRYTALHLREGAIVPTPPSAVLARGYGDCKDLSVLVASCLRRVGVRAEVALAMADGPVPRDGLPGLEPFKHMIVVVPDPKGGEPLWLDATAPVYPAGVLPVAVRNQRSLVVSASTRGLVSTPTSRQTPLVYRETIEARLAPFGEGSARLALESGGAAEGYARSQAEPCDAAAAHKLAQDTVSTLFGELPFTAALRNCKAGDGQLTVVAELGPTPVLETGDRLATLRLPSQLILKVAPEGLAGPKPKTDERTDAEKQDERQRMLEETGMAPEDLERRAFDFGFRPLAERLYRITLPPRFAVGTLPPDRTLAMGPSTFTETYARVDERTVEARFRFEAERSEWSVEDVKAFRDAFWKRFSGAMPELVFTFEPAKLLEERHPAEAVALARRWLAEQPADAQTRARFARMLMGLGLNELARQEAERALKDAPDDPFVLMVRGDVARADANGVMYRPPFERARALECLRKAHEKLPDHGWSARALAETLRRNEAGELVSGWTAEHAEAASVLQAMAERRGGEWALTALTDLYLRARRDGDLKALYEKHPSLREGNEPGPGVIAEVLSGTVEGTLRRLEQISEPKARFSALAAAYSVLGHLRHYDEAQQLVERFQPGDALAREVGVLKTMNAGLKAVPDAVDTSTPELAARGVLAAFANGTSPTEMSARLARLASARRKADFGASKALRHARLPGLDSPFPFEQLYHRAQCVTAGDAQVARVRCELPENGGLAVTSYWVAEGGSWRLESLGEPAQLAGLAWALSSQRKAGAAGAWIGWLVDELGARDNRSEVALLLKDLWAEAKHDDPEAARLAAAIGQLTYSDMAKAAPKAALEALEKGRLGLSGALRRRADAALARALDLRRDWAKAAKVLEPLASSENEQRLWRWLTMLEANLGRGPSALARVDKALAKDPASTEWRMLKATVCLHSGKHAEAYQTLKQLRADKGDGAGSRNNLLWSQLMADQLDEEAEREALRLANEKTVSEAELHTAAMVLLQRSRAGEAAAYGGRRQQRMGDETDDAQRLYRARLLQVLGFDEAARAEYARIGSDDPEFVELRKRYLAPPRKQP